MQDYFKSSTYVFQHAGLYCEMQRTHLYTLTKLPALNFNHFILIKYHSFSAMIAICNISLASENVGLSKRENIFYCHSPTQPQLKLG